MKIQVIIALVVFGQLDAHVLPLGVTVGITPYSHPIATLYHTQNNYGQYVYGYATPTSSKTETKTADGTTHGGYSYIDADGILQTVQYIADPIHGFRVAATNLPKDLPDVAIAKAKHFSEYAAVQAEHAQIAAQRLAPSAISVALSQPVQDLPEVALAKAQHLATLQAAYNAPTAIPQPVQDLPEVVKARNEHLAVVEATKVRDAAINISPIPAEISQTVVPVQTAATHPVVTAQSQISYTPAVWYDATPTSQYQSQDALGQYSYGYVGPLSSKAETKTADGVTRGGYSYIDANGILQTVNYISDPVNGFRVAATNLPVAAKTTLVAPAAPAVVTKAATALPVAVENKEHVHAVPLVYTQEFHY